MHILQSNVSCCRNVSSSASSRDECWCGTCSGGVCDNSTKLQTRFHRQRRWELTEQLSTPLRTKNKLLKYWTKIWSSDKGSGEKTHFAEKQIDAPKACLSPADVHKQRTKARLPKDPTDLTRLTLLFFFFYSAHLCIVHRGTFLEIGAY